MSDFERMQNAAVIREFVQISGCDRRTVKKYLSGENVSAAMRSRLEAARKEFGRRMLVAERATIRELRRLQRIAERRTTARPQ
jgi:hypothetical protein